MQIFDVDGQMCLFDQDGFAGKTWQAYSAAEAPRGKISGLSSRKSSELKYAEFLSLDLTPGHGNLLGESYWEVCSPWRIEQSTLNTGVSPSEDRDVSLWLILQEDVPPKYYLTRRACTGILRRAFERGKPLPPRLEIALRIQAGLLSTDYLYLLSLADEREIIAFVQNQRDEVRNLRDIAGALGAQPGMKQQTFIAASFSPGAGSTAGGVAYSEKCAPTLKGSAGGNMMPSIMCLCDQGGKRMDCAEELVGTLRSQDHGHHPIVMSEGKSGARQTLYENHGADSRYNGPHDVSPTLPARAGTGRSNLPIVTNSEPAVYNRQRVDVFKENDITSTESARQSKDATDLVCRAEPVEIVDDENNPAVLLIRRLTPVECERLMGLKDGYTDIPEATDSKRYRALGNGVVIQCVEYIMRGIALAVGEAVDNASISF